MTADSPILTPYDSEYNENFAACVSKIEEKKYGENKEETKEKFEIKLASGNRLLHIINENG